MIGHKFKPITNRLRSTLEAGEIYFAPPESLNDPFDCQIDVTLARELALASKGLSSTALQAKKWAYITAMLEKLLKTCGVFSLCNGEVSGANSHLFWPHYGEDHKGVCLTYDIPESFVIEKQIGVGAVKYDPEELFESLTALNLETIPSTEDMTPTIIALLTTKTAAWSYEDEFRLVSYEPGPQKIPKEWLKQVCFGLKTSMEVRQGLIDSMKSWGYGHCVFAEIARAGDSLFGLKINELSPGIKFS